MGFFEKLKQGLSKTHDNIFSKVDKLVYGKSEIDDDFLEKLEEILLGSDVGVKTTETLINNLKGRVKAEKYERADELNSMLKDEIKKVFTCLPEQTGSNGLNETEIQIKNKSVSHPGRPYVILIIGVNGTGKTTSVGKLAYNYKNTGYSVLIGAADTFRAAANEQLETWAKRADVEIIQLKYGSDPGAVVFNTVNSAIAKNYDIVIIDTAGRLHTKTNLMEELKKVKRVIQKILPDAPDEVLLVIDSTTGQNGLNQAKEFSNAVGVTGLILTKLDGTAKGGIVLRINQELSIPVRYIGVGEQIDDLQEFDSKSFVEALIADNR
ncbi:MAG: signal recognition particle-docking protein FtsY [Ignavibacteria bacterium]